MIDGMNENGLCVSVNVISDFENTKEFVKAVEENPTVSGWDNRIVTVSSD